MRAHTQKWGNSLAIRIPKAFAEELGLDSGSAVEIAIQDGHLVIAPSDDPAYQLDELLAQITDENRHEEVSTGEVMGREVW